MSLQDQLEAAATSSDGDSTSDVEQGGTGVDPAEALAAGVREEGARVTVTDSDGTVESQTDTLSDEFDPMEPGSGATYAGAGPSDPVREEVVESDPDVTNESAGVGPDRDTVAEQVAAAAQDARDRADDVEESAPIGVIGIVLSLVGLGYAIFGGGD